MQTPPTDLVYLDNNATTALDPAVLEAMLPWLREGYGNPSSKHAMGEPAARAIAGARSAVARLVGAKSPREVVFTSGGTESINSALFAALRARPEARRIVTSTAEHAATANPARRLSEDGYDVVACPVDGEGRLDVDAVIAAVQPGTAICSLLWANNETGVVVPDADLRRIAERCRKTETPLHLDAVQVAGKRPIAADALGIDLLSVSGHKFHGPKGVGAVWIRTGLPYSAHVEGGTQEDGRRGGTLNTPGIVGLGQAAELAAAHAADGAACAQVAARRDRLERGLLERVPDARVNGGGAERVASTANLSFA
ncbi:MAG: aminotransferase class V-fold PLP-dependent enzyme, partial [Planctomycetota bacterium]